ncbi:uncharacterized protein LOC116407614 isoform X2 [Xenopus tropicalis]|uniref:Uncharacterized LOC116407614 n=1 Tax=Xenopus tropicalis TaxID=8364 RepID=A0A803JU77_XENTR|nr:uncharacterized protein LOC116407614 isoform X2 [Xenopus tropicalis]
MNEKADVALKNPGMSVFSSLDSELENESEYSCLSMSKTATEVEKHEETAKEMQCEEETVPCEHNGLPNPSVPKESEKGVLQDVIAMSLSERNEECHNPKKQINDSDEVTAQVTSDNLHLNLEIRNVSSSDRTKVVITNKKSLKKSRSYHDSQHQQSQHNAHNRDISVDDVNRKSQENPNKQNSEMPLIKVEIIGAGIEVKYKTIDRHLTVHIERDNERKEREERETCYFHSNDYLQEGTWSSYSSDFSPYQREEMICSDCCIDIPPPEEFADVKCVSPNTNVGNEALIHDLLRKSCSISSIFSSHSESETERRPIKDECYKTEHMPLLDNRLCMPCLNNCTNCSHLTVKPYKMSCNHISSISPQEIHSNTSGCIHHPNQNSVFDSVVRRKTFPEIYYNPHIHSYNSRHANCKDHSPEQSSTSNSCTERCLNHVPSIELRRSFTALPCRNCVNDHHEPECKSILLHSERAASHFVNTIEDPYFVGSCSDTPSSKRNTMPTDMDSVRSLHNLDINNKHSYEEEDTEDLKHNEDQIDFTESGFDEEMQDGDNVIETQDYSELQNKCLLIQVTPPSRSSSKEFIIEKNVYSNLPNDCVQTSLSQTMEIPQSSSTVLEMSQRKRRGSVVTVVTGDLEQRLLVQGDNQAVSDSVSSRGYCELHKDIQQSPFVQRNSVLTPVSDVDEAELENKLLSSFEEQSQPTLKDISSQTSQSFDPFLSMENQSNFEDTQETVSRVEEGSDMNFPADDTSPRNSSDSAIPGTSFESIAGQLSSLKKSDSEENGVKCVEKRDDSCEKSETPKQFAKKDAKPEFVNKHLRLPKESVIKESRACEITHEGSEASDRWAKKRKQFKETKNCNSAGGSSVTSNITEESGNSEETRSVDLGVRSDGKDKGLYTESFHSTSWIFRGDDCSPDNSPRCLSKRPRSVAIRERTVRIAKGTGDYPWGFRIQFSKPILVTEVDTNGAAEEAGLQVGDIVMAVNGTDVTSIPHSEAACLARQGPDLLTLVVGSDISRFPTTPRPSCRGYLHKRTHSGLLKGWRKRWFVLKHDGSLQYYKHKKDEGKCRPLEVTKLEGSEIGVDTTLGKPFVFKCVPQSANRIFYFCATSNQEMKRWLEAMDKAVHPLTQNHVWVDVTMHNLSLPPLAIKNPECLGLLHQLDRNKDVWMQHYCILKDGCLYFYSSIRSTSALGGIYLQGYTVTEQSLNSRRCIIELRPPSEEFKAFYLSAGNAAENKRWITALKMSINKWLPLHQAIQDFMSRPLEETRM